MNALPLALALVFATAQVHSGPPASLPAPSPAVTIVTGVSQIAEDTGPYRKLFRIPVSEVERQQRLSTARELLRQAAGKTAPKIVCSMVVIAADPQIDPKIIHRPPASTGTMHIRKIPPTACAE